MGFTFAGYQEASRDAGGPSPGARALMSYCLGRWDFAFNLGIYASRNVRGGSSLSHHAEGRALDIGIPMLGRTRADAAKGMLIVDAVGTHGQRLGVDHLIYDRRIWSSRSAGGRKYTGTAPHYDHIHLGLTRKAGANLNLPTIEAVIGALDPAPPEPSAPELERVTHRVTAGSLRLRREPSMSGAQIGSLPRGAEVATVGDAPVEAGGHRWLEVQAIAGGRLQEGWVASAYLEEVSQPPTPAGPELERVTHRVKASTLHLRREPSTSAGIVTGLPNGTAVEDLATPARREDGHRWIRVRAIVKGTLVEGWVASEYLDPVR